MDWETGERSSPPTLRPALPPTQDGLIPLTGHADGKTRVMMPIMGVGTSVPTDGSDAIGDAIYEAIKIGYRHIDAAEKYGNEKEVGEGIRRACEELGLEPRGHSSSPSKHGAQTITRMMLETAANVSWNALAQTTSTVSSCTGPCRFQRLCQKTFRAENRTAQASCFKVEMR